MGTYGLTLGSDGYRSGATFVNSDPNVVLSPGAERVGLYFTGLVPRSTFGQATLSITATAAAAGLLKVYVVCADSFLRPEASPTFFSDLRLPGALPYELLLGGMALGAGVHTAQALTLANLDPATAPNRSLLAFLRHSAFTGAVPLELEWDATSLGTLDFQLSGSGAGATLGSGTELPFLTGLDGWEYANGMSRVDECPVTGKRTLREGWVQNGWNRTLVHPSGYDPEDYVEKYVHYERPPLKDAG